MAFDNLFITKNENENLSAIVREMKNDRTLNYVVKMNLTFLLSLWKLLIQKARLVYTILTLVCMWIFFYIIWTLWSVLSSLRLCMIVKLFKRSFVVKEKTSSMSIERRLNNCNLKLKTKVFVISIKSFQCISMGQRTLFTCYKTKHLIQWVFHL